MASRPPRFRLVVLVLATALPLVLSAVALLYTIPPGTRRGLAAALIAVLATALSAALAWILGRRIAAYCDELAQARIQAERALDLHKDVLASVSHDVQSPLSAASGYLQLLQTRIAAAPDAPARNVHSGLVQTQRAVSRVQHITEELVDAARLERGLQLTLRLQPLDLIELVGECVATEAPAVQKRISRRCRSSDLWIVGDGDRVGRAISNLISNAAKYSPSTCRIELILRREMDPGAEWIVLTVRDYGIGIPADDLPHVFDPFRRGSNAAVAYPGTGLGLAGVRSVVLQHGGRVVIESQQGIGTSVHVYFPATACATATQAAQDWSLRVAG